VAGGCGGGGGGGVADECALPFEGWMIFIGCEPSR
jgi:hypothetical protein